jgi:hypothetical protein
MNSKTATKSTKPTPQISRLAPGLFFVRGASGDYLVRRGVGCSCPAGKNGRACYHLPAVRAWAAANPVEPKAVPAPAPKPPSIRQSQTELERVCRQVEEANRQGLGELLVEIVREGANDDAPLSEEEAAERWDEFENERGWGDEEELPEGYGE